MVRPISIGLVGTGAHGSRYARHLLNDVPGLSLAAVSRRSPIGEEQAREWGVRFFPRWQDLIEDSAVDAVIAVTTPNLNPAIAAACARAKKPLLVEKPLAVDVASASGMVDGFASAGISLTVGHTLRYNTIVLSLQKELPRIGTIRSFAANHRLEPSPHLWQEDPEVAGGGVILHTAVHLFDALRFITRREVRSIQARTYRRMNPVLEDLVIALVEMEGDIVGTVDAGKVSPARTARFEFVGSEGQLHGDHVQGRLEMILKQTVLPLPSNPLSLTIIPLLKDWESHLRGAGPNPIPGEEGLAAVRICEACRRSAMEERPITL